MALTQVSTGGIKDGQVQTADLADSQITAAKLHADALDRTYTLGADGINHYTFTGEGLTGAVNDPTLYLTRGKTYRFVNGNSSGAHPFRIQTTVNGSAGTEYNTGVTNNGGAGGSTIVFEVPHDAPDVLYYQCTSHNAMGGIFYVTGALADGTVTEAKLANNAVTQAKINAGSVGTGELAALAVTAAKIANGVVGTSELADQGVTLAKLEHGTSSNDGKFLRANNGADPTFETVSGTTINNNADNRVITGSGTANTLNGEADFTYDGKALLTGGTAELEVKGSVQGRVIYTDTASNSGKRSYDITSNGDRLKVRSLSDDFTSSQKDAINVEGNTGIVTLASNPYWIGHKSGGYTSGSGWTTISIDSTRFEGGGTNWDTSNYYYTVPISGVYQITINVEMTHVNQQSWIYFQPRIDNNDTTTTNAGIPYVDFSPKSYAGSGASAYFAYHRVDVCRLIAGNKIRFQTTLSGNNFQIGGGNQNSYSIVYLGVS